MAFRVRPSSKKSEESERSLVELPMLRNYQPGGGEIRSIGLRLDAVQNNFASHQDVWRRQRDISNSAYLELQKRFDMLEYKAFTNEKDIKKLIQFSSDHRGPPSQQQAITDNAKAYYQNQMSTLKHALIQERQSNKEQAKHQNQLTEQMNRRQMRLESEIRDLISKQREDYDSRLSEQIEDIRTNENIKQQKIENQYQMMKSLISNTERKILGEFERKLRNETVIKDYIEDKIAELKEQNAMDQRGMLSKESKFVREIKESIESIFSIIKNTQKELTEELSETQKISANNFKRLSMTVQLVKERMGEQLANLTDENNQTKSEIVDLKNFVNVKLEENRELIMEMEEENYNQPPQKGSRVGSFNGSQQKFGSGSDQTESTRNLQKQFNQWKAMTEQKNLNVFKQISSTLKTMKLEWKKQNDEISSEVGSFKESVTNVKKSVPLQIKKSVQTVITIFNNEFDTLAQELDTITQMIALSKKETEKTLKEQIKKTESEILKEVKGLIKSSQKQTILSFQKSLIKQQEAMRSHVSQQNKFLKDLLTQKQNSIENEVEQVAASSKKNNLNTNTQLEDFTLKLKSFNQNYKDYLEEQRKDDLKKRIELEENMRKNSSNLMDLCYKKSQFLVDGMKKAIQMNQMKDKVTFTREVEALKEETQKKMFQTKQEIIEDMSQKMDKLSEERESSEQIMHQAFDQQVNMVKKTLSNEIGNSKLQLSEKINQLVETINELKIKESKSTQDSDKKISQLHETIKQLQSRGTDSTEELQKRIKQLEEAINELKSRGSDSTEELQKKINQFSQAANQQKIKYANSSEEMERKISQLSTAVEQLKTQGTDSTQELQNNVQSLKQAVWKIEAMSFSQQAKNKAIMDRLGEDIVELSNNLQKINTELKPNSQKK